MKKSNRFAHAFVVIALFASIYPHAAEAACDCEPKSSQKATGQRADETTPSSNRLPIDKLNIHLFQGNHAMAGSIKAMLQNHEDSALAAVLSGSKKNVGIIDSYVSGKPLDISDQLYLNSDSEGSFNLGGVHSIDLSKPEPKFKWLHVSKEDAAHAVALFGAIQAHDTTKAIGLLKQDTDLYLELRKSLHKVVDHESSLGETIIDKGQWPQSKEVTYYTVENDLLLSDRDLHIYAADIAQQQAAPTFVKAAAPQVL